jgi:hypothetical protein
LYDEIIHAHGDQIDPDRAVKASPRGNLDLGANAVICGDKKGISKTRSLEIENPSKAPDFGLCPTPPCGAHQRLDRFDYGIAGIYVDTGTGISVAILALHCASLPLPLSPKRNPTAATLVKLKALSNRMDKFFRNFRSGPLKFAVILGACQDKGTNP